MYILDKSGKTSVPLNLALLILMTALILHPALSIPWVWGSPILAIKIWRVCLVVSTIVLGVSWFGIWTWPPESQQGQAKSSASVAAQSPSAKSEQGTAAASKSLTPVGVISLYRLFKEDRPGIKSVDFLPVRIHVQNSNSVLSVEPRLHADFVGLSKFVSFYVPSSSDVIDVIRFIADNYLGLTGMDQFELVLTKPGEYPQSTDGMKFTGSIVIYHEDDLSNAALANLEDYYRGRQLTPIWRGTAYIQTQILLRNDREELLRLSQVPSSMAAPSDQLSITGVTAGVNGEQIDIKNKGKAGGVPTQPLPTPNTEASPHSPTS
jgi:hypothetical protein